MRKFTAGPNCGGGGVLSAATTAVHASYSNGGGSYTPQLNDTGNTHRLDSLGDRLMQKVQYRRIGVTESLWVVHTGPISNTANDKPQWVQVNVTGGTISTTPVQQQIYAPDTTIYRWMPAIATDNAGNTAVAYSTSNTSMFPSLAYSGRLATDR